MASASTEMVPYSSNSNRKWSYDVFLSFRGADTRYNFTDHLYTALVQSGFKTFKDDDLYKGAEIAATLLQAIEESRSSVVILSKTYADSTWCLEELAKIMECRRESGSLVFPIFYDVEPSDVRNQSGSFGEAFAKHDEHRKDKVQRWRAALTEAANLTGYPLPRGYESTHIKQIIDHLTKRLGTKLFPVEELVGMDIRLKDLKSLLNIHLHDILMVGIYGPSGVGKTTTAKVVYNDVLRQFDGSSFLEAVKSRSRRDKDRLQLLQQLLRDLLEDQKVELNNINEGINMIKCRLGSKRVFVVIDDVDDPEQVKSLVKSFRWFGLGSRIILTTREKHLLHAYGVDDKYIHEAKVLCDEESIQLFSWHAFRQKAPTEDYKEMSNLMVNYAQGLPLAIKVLGSFLNGSAIYQWETTLGRLTKEGQEIENVLKICYDGLDDNEKDILLDIACFFEGEEDKDFVVRMLNACNFYADIGVRVLCDRCLISISNNKISMHDLIQQLGRTIVRQKSPKNPSQWSRLWNPVDVGHVLGKRNGSKRVETISCDLSMSSEEMQDCHTDVLTKMKRLRLVKLHGSDHYGEVKLPTNFALPSQELRYLHWEAYPLKTLPPNFRGDNLVELHLRNSNIEQLSNKSKGFEKLKVIDLSYSKHLIKVPSFSSIPNLERLNLEGCTSLCKLPPSIGALKCLTYLNLGGCEKLQSLPSGMKFESLEVLNLNGCRALKNFPEAHENLKHLKELYLQKSGIEELPSSIGSLTSLEILDLSKCLNFKIFPEIHGNMKSLRELWLSGTGLRELPRSIGHLTSLEILDLSECLNFEKSPEIDWGNMKILRELCLNGTRIKELPASIGLLKSLEILDLSDCSNLEKLPDAFSNMEHLRKLYLSSSGIREVPGNIWSLLALQTLSLRSCSNFKKLPEIQRNNKESPLLDLELEGTAITELPASIGHFTSLTSLNLENCINLRSLPISIKDLRGLQWLKLINCHDLETLPADGIGNLTCLTTLVLRNSWKLRNLPDSLRSLQFCLRTLDIGGCNLMEEEIPSDLWCLTSLEFLDVSDNRICSIPSGIIRLSKLKTLRMNHCLMLEEIPELPLSVRRIEAHGCPRLESLSTDSTHVLWSSLLNCFKSLIQARDLEDSLVQNENEGSYKQHDIDLCRPTSSGNLDKEEDLCGRNSDEPLGQIDVFLPGSNGIPKWVSCKKRGWGKIRVQLPMNWNEDTNFLGFALFFHLSHVDLVNEYVIADQECRLTISVGYQSEMVDTISLDPFCDAYWTNSICLSLDPALRVTYFPRRAIPDHFRSSCRKNLEVHLKNPYFSCKCGKKRNFEVESCGIHLIYAQDHKLVREKTSPTHDDTDDQQQHKRSRHL